MTLQDTLDRLSREGELYTKLEEKIVQCHACAHRCRIAPGGRGFCKVRFNEAGTLRVPWGYVAGLNVDPIEKKPFAHFLPGAGCLTFGMLGCNFHCEFCQNWVSSQALRDPCAETSAGAIRRVDPEQIIEVALRYGARVIASSYNEPLITSEWAVSVFRLAKENGLKCVYVSNGFATPETLAYLRPWLDGYKVDLKSMQEKHYREMGGKLQTVLDCIGSAHEMGLWVEAVTLVIPGYNDSVEELWDAARFLASVSPDIPWHVTGFHPDYKMEDRPATSADLLLRAAEVGQEAGLHYLYAGNLPGRVGSLEDTFCPQCNHRLVQRRGYTILGYTITPEGSCPRCGAAVAGVWR